jgi:biotin synthase
VQLSNAAAITLGLEPGQMIRTSCTHCLNLLLTYPEGCRANCSYCGLARHREENKSYAQRNFIRVNWPTVELDEIIEAVKRGDDQGQFQRMCISMITHPSSDDDSFEVLQKWQEQLSHIPVSILSNPTTLNYEDLVRFKAMGADIFTVALDATTPEIFERTRGRSVDSPHQWDVYWRCLEWAAEIFGPERFGAHLICGMGETEQEFLTVCQQIKDLGGHNHLFAFYPEQGSLMEDWPAVPQSQWRRVQLARYLIDYCEVRVEQMKFNDAGQVLDFAITQNALDALLNEGTAFRTSGCPGNQSEDVSACNRPYGDSPPTDIRSFPFAPVEADIETIKRQLHGENIPSNALID